jgi:hypothetical protein
MPHSSQLHIQSHPPIPSCDYIDLRSSRIAIELSKYVKVGSITEGHLEYEENRMLLKCVSSENNIYFWKVAYYSKWKNTDRER